MEDWLFPKNKKINSQIPDIYLVSFQEIVELNTTYILFKSNSHAVDNWKIQIQDSLNKISKKYDKNFESYQDEFILIKTLELVGILMVVFIKRKHFMKIKNIDYLIKKTGAQGILGNKGSVLYRFDLFNKSFAFSSGHFAAGQNAMKARTEELFDVMNCNINSNSSIDTFKGRLIDHNFWFIFGDLNFRLDLDNDQVRTSIRKRDYERLASYDQLNKLKTQDKDFYCIYEGKINFNPTYKYNIGTSDYETKKNRVPSWCDRILFNRSNKINLIQYDTIQNMSFSDHKPVFAFFNLKLDDSDNKNDKILSDKIININNQTYTSSNVGSIYEHQNTKSNNNNKNTKNTNFNSNQENDNLEKKTTENDKVETLRHMRSSNTNENLISDNQEQIAKMFAEKQKNKNIQSLENRDSIEYYNKRESNSEIEMNLINNIPNIPVNSPYENINNNTKYNDKNLNEQLKYNNRLFVNKNITNTQQNNRHKPINKNNTNNKNDVVNISEKLLDLDSPYSNDNSNKVQKKNTKDMLKDIFNEDK